MLEKKLKSEEKPSAEVFGDGKMAKLPTNDEEFTTETINALPAHLLIKIESFSLLLGREVEKCESKEFEAGGYKWTLIIHPDGPIKSKNDDEHHISAYMAIVENNSMPVGWEVNALFRIFLYNQILDNYLCFQGKIRRFHAMKTQWGFSKLLSSGCLRDPKNGFLVDDSCVFGAEVAVIKTQRVTERVSLLKVSGPFRCDWKISNYSKLNAIWLSEEFTVGNKKWKVKLFPNGNGSSKDESVAMFLECVDSKRFASHEKVKADFCLSIRNQLSVNHHSKTVTHFFTSSEDDWGFKDFIPLSDMRDPKKGFVIDDCCIVEAEIFVGAIT